MTVIATATATATATASALPLFRYDVNGFLIMARHIENQTRNVIRVSVSAPWSSKENPIKFHRDIELSSVTSEQAFEKALALSARFGIGASKFDHAYQKEGRLLFNDEKLHFTIKANAPAPAAAPTSTADIPSATEVASVATAAVSRKSALQNIGQRMRNAS